MIAEKDIQFEGDNNQRELARVGKFRIDMDSIEQGAADLESRTSLTEVFSNCIIIRAEALYFEHCIEYQAFSKYFEILEGGREIPYYVWSVTVKKEEGKADQRTIEVKRIG